MHRHKILKRGFSLKVHFEDTVYIFFFLHALDTFSRRIYPLTLASGHYQSTIILWQLKEEETYPIIQEWL